MTKAVATQLFVLSALIAGASTIAACKRNRPATGPADPTGKELTLDLGNKIQLRLVNIPAGKFMMGSSPEEKGHQGDEVQHEVTITRRFYMGAMDVTVDQYAQFAKDSGYKSEAEREGYSYSEQIKDGFSRLVKVSGLSWKNPGFVQKGNYPAVHIAWNDAQAFCQWLSKKSGKNVTLPTEAQWEYACRAGTTTAFPWGDDPNAGKGWANCADQSLKLKLFNWKNGDFFNWDDGFVYTSPVGTFKPNAFGLYDMIGNVRQWCNDRFGDYDKENAVDPSGPAKGKSRVQRGNSWHGLMYDCRAAFRQSFVAGFVDDSFGFRVVVLLREK